MKTTSRTRISSPTLLLLAVVISGCNGGNSAFPGTDGDSDSSLGGAGGSTDGSDDGTGGGDDATGSGPTESCEAGSFVPEVGEACEHWTDSLG